MSVISSQLVTSNKNLNLIRITAGDNFLLRCIVGGCIFVWCSCIIGDSDIQSAFKVCDNVPNIFNSNRNLLK